MTGRATSEETAFRRSIGKRLRIQRIIAELSQDELAAKAAVTRNFISAMERGAQGLDLWRLLKVADALGMQLQKLVQR